MAFVPPARHLLRAKDLADARYFEPLGVDDLARTAGLSRAHFSREFRRAFGESPHAYLLTRRLERTAALLRTTDRSVADICLSVGLLSVGSFTTSFTSTYGVSPTVYRADVPAGGPPSARPYLRHASRLLHQKLGMEARADVTVPEMGHFRWVTVGPAGQPDVAIVLMAIPGAPIMDDEAAEQVRSLMAKGFAGTIFLTTEDCQASYEELTGRGVEFTEPPEERPYGIDSAFRDPSGNSIRLTQVTQIAVA